MSTIFITHLKSFDSYPIIFYVFFIAILLWCRMKVKKCSENGGSSKEIEKIIDQWSGLVDGIGTALPLLGAAGILFTVGMGREYQSLFIEFAVPFEIKSLFILAIAKLLDFAFDELDRQYVGNDIENTKQVDFSGVTSTILPDLQTLERLNTVIASWKAAVNEMQKKDFKDTIDSLNKLTGREQSNK
ncbi:MAG: hypothetical protein IPM96_10310 [Ignavibacteria bacterium]|nr:hypothetical protein [Ignavibacteria bacterium]